MSYADAAASGPKQTPEQARAPAPPEVIHTTDSSTASLIDVDSDHVSTVASDFSAQETKTRTQAERYEREAKDEAIELKDEAAKDAKKAKEIAEEKAKEAKKYASEKGHEAKDYASKKAGEAKAQAKKTEKSLQANSDNPVFIGNAVAVVGLSALLGFGGYRKYAAGELTWKVVGVWTSVVGLFAAGDYYLSQYLFKNKYPKK